jgi:hypothetical protein
MRVTRRKPAGPARRLLSILLAVGITVAMLLTACGTSPSKHDPKLTTLNYIIGLINQNVRLEDLVYDLYPGMVARA